jgi:PAS domain S-box-containing protein
MTAVPDLAAHPPTPPLTLVVDGASLCVTLASHDTARVLGHPLSVLVGMPITEIECALQGVFFWEEVKAGRPQGVLQQEDLYRCADGRLIEVVKTVTPLLQGQPTASAYLIVATASGATREVHDVLAQTLSRLRATLEATSNGVMVLDWNGQIGSMNRRFGQMWGVPEGLLNRQDDAQIVAHLVGSVQESALMHARLTAVADPGATEDVVHHHDGRIFEFSARPQYMDEQIVGRVFSVQDITQRTHDAEALRASRDELERRVRERTADLEQLNLTLNGEKERLARLVRELEAAQAQLMQSERMASIGQLAAGVAHEINNPVGFVYSNLGTLKTYVHSLLQLLTAYEQVAPQLPDGDRQTVERACKEADLAYLREDVGSLLTESLEGLQRVTRIVQDLKNFSHPTESENQLADLEQGLESTLRVVWNELKYKTQVVREFAGLPKIMCRPFQLNQVFMNLLVNASQAIETQGTIWVRTGFDTQWLWVEVQDTGKGIPEEHLARIFDPFFTTKPVGKGTGLGLSLAYGIVQKHGGRIDVSSAVGQGSTFRVWIPREPPEGVVVR